MRFFLHMCLCVLTESGTNSLFMHFHFGAKQCMTNQTRVHATAHSAHTNTLLNICELKWNRRHTLRVCIANILIFWSGRTVSFSFYFLFDAIIKWTKGKNDKSLIHFDCKTQWIIQTKVTNENKKKTIEKYDKIHFMDLVWKRS